MGRVGYATTKIHQLTGEYDRERNVACINATESRYGILGTDLGSSFEHDGRLWFLFGDTVAANLAYNDWRPDAGDCIAWTTDADPERGVSLTFITAPDGKYLSPRIVPDVPRGPFNVPLEGFSAGGNMYVFFSTDADLNAPGGVKMGRSVLTRAINPDQALFQNLYTFSDFRQGGKFVNVSVSIVDNATVPGLPMHTGRGLVIFGSGAYRASNPFLAWMPLDHVEQPDSIRYFSGDASRVDWSLREADATALVDQPQIGELCVRYIPEIEDWLMLYNAATPRGINMRTASTPWGPWSETTVLFDPGSDGGYGHFMHANWNDNGRADAVHDPNRENEWGGEYGPYLIPRYTRRVNNELHVYFVMSTWNPYNTVLMRGRLRLHPWRGWYSLSGAAFPPGASVTSASRGPNQLEVWAVDNAGTVRGNWFDETWHGWYSLAGPTFPPGASVTSASRGPNQLEVWAVDNAGTVRGNWFDETWRGWYSLAGATFPPGACVTSVSRGPNQLEVWAVDNTGTVRGNWFDETWRGWYSLADGAPTLSVGGAVSAVKRTAQTMSVFTVDQNGAAYVASFQSVWAKWAQLAGAEFPPGARPTSVSRHQDRMEIWVVDIDGTVRGNWFDIS